MGEILMRGRGDVPMKKYIHKVSGDVMCEEEALDMIGEARCNEHDDIFGMSDKEALEHAFEEVE